MQSDKMKDGDVDNLLRQYLSGDQPREALKQKTLRDSLTSFGRVRRQRSARRRAQRVAAAVLIAGIAFLGGRLSAPQKLPRSEDIAPQAAAKPEGVFVASDLIAWLDAARLFKRLGMEERMDRAFDKASKLLPYDAVAASSVTRQATVTTGDDVLENQNKHSILTDIFDSYESVESTSGIIAQSFGGNYYESKMD